MLQCFPSAYNCGAPLQRLASMVQFAPVLGVPLAHVQPGVKKQLPPTTVPSAVMLPHSLKHTVDAVLVILNWWPDGGAPHVASWHVLVLVSS